MGVWSEIEGLLVMGVSGRGCASLVQMIRMDLWERWTIAVDFLFSRTKVLSTVWFVPDELTKMSSDGWPSR